MGVYSLTAGAYRTAWFTEVNSAEAVERVKAVVVRRVVVERESPVSALLAAVAKVLGRRRPAPPAARAPRVVPLGWSASVGPDHEVLFSRDRAVLRVRGVDYALPSEQRALLVTVDETAPGVSATVKTKIAMAPTAAWSPWDQISDQAERRRLRREQVRAASKVWRTWLESEPFVTAFVGPTGGA